MALWLDGLHLPDLACHRGADNSPGLDPIQFAPSLLPSLWSHTHVWSAVHKEMRRQERDLPQWAGINLTAAYRWRRRRTFADSGAIGPLPLFGPGCLHFVVLRLADRGRPLTWLPPGWSADRRATWLFNAVVPGVGKLLGPLRRRRAKRALARMLRRQGFPQLDVPTLRAPDALSRVTLRAVVRRTAGY